MKKVSMDHDNSYLGHFEEAVLCALLRLKDDAYGVKIRQLLEKEQERPISIGAVYTTLDRLERKSYVSSRQGESTPVRGGRAKRYFKLEGAGIAALNRTAGARNKFAGSGPMWEPVRETI